MTPASSACDFYHRYPGDIALMRELGLDAFRFSIAWPRIVPRGRGPVNEAGLDFYDRLVDELLAHEIEPFATLFHWDTPQALEDAGGWPSRATAEAFVDYTAAVARRLGDRVHHWITHNEPWVHAWIGHSWGEHAPGRTSERGRRRGRASPAPLARLGGGGDPAPSPPMRGSGSRSTWRTSIRRPTRPEDEAAAWQVDGEGNRWFLDPIFRGAYPADLLERNELVAPFVEDGDLETISAPLDFLGVNNYSRFVVRAGADGPGDRERLGGAAAPTWAGRCIRTGSTRSWSAPPATMRRPRSTSPRTVPLSATSAATTAACTIPSGPPTSSRTSPRSRARSRDGAPVKGYFVWSLLDNFEWQHGYSKRFGIVYVDYPTLERVPKDSFYWYRDFIASNPGVPRPSPVATG